MRREAPGFAPADVVNSHGVYLIYGEDDLAPGLRGPRLGPLPRHRRHDRRGDGLPLQPASLRAACKGYAGYLPFLEKPAHILGNEELTVGGLILAVTGLMLLLLAATGLVVWWPGIRRLARGLRVRRRQGTYAFNYDLHNVVGVAAVPFLVMWGLTGAHFELKQVSELWYAVLPGERRRGARRSSRSPSPGRPVTMDEAAAIARRTVPDGRLISVSVPDKEKTSTYFSYLAQRQRPVRPRRLSGQRRRHDRPLQRRGDGHLSGPGRSRRSRPSSSTTGSIRCTGATRSTAGGGSSGWCSAWRRCCWRSPG